MAYAYQLEKYKSPSSRRKCPACGKKELALYQSTTTGEHLADHVGRCNREDSCGYHYTPKQYFQENPDAAKNLMPETERPADITPKPASLINIELFKRSRTAYDQNNFVQWLIMQFGAAHATRAVEVYNLGTSKHWPGANVFWQQDSAGNVRTGKVMLYNPATGKRVKEPFNHITWVHRLLKDDTYNLQQCMFGEHLLKVPGNQYKPVAIVESEKTAVVASLYYPAFIWLACGGLNNLSGARFTPLISRDVVLFPDLNAFGKWQEKAQRLEHLCNISVSDILEQIATDEEKERGLDLADYLQRYDVTLFGLKQAFKTELMAAVTEDQQAQIWERYRAQGLQAADAKAVIDELLFKESYTVDNAGYNSATAVRAAEPPPQGLCVPGVISSLPLNQYLATTVF